MKKNLMMRLASFLLVAVLISTSAISGTYAKYVTTASGSDTARVAKWGVQVAVSGALFSDSYVEVADGNTPGSTDLTVKSSNSDKLVAPGTKNTEGITFSITGKPEVSVQIDVQIEDGVARDVYLADGTYLDWTTGISTTAPDADKDTFTLATPTGSYRPLIYTLVNDKNEELAKGTLETIETYLEDNLSQIYPPNTVLEGIAGGTTGDYTLTWEWAFEQSSNVSLYDKADTLLGNLAAGIDTSVNSDAYNLGANVSITITATQVD